jgi:hypothetical protein
MPPDAVVVTDDPPPDNTPTTAEIIALVEAARAEGQTAGAAMQLLSDRLAVAEATVATQADKIQMLEGRSDGIGSQFEDVHRRVSEVETAHNETRGRVDEIAAFLSEDDMPPEPDDKKPDDAPDDKPADKKPDDAPADKPADKKPDTPDAKDLPVRRRAYN